MKILGLLLLLAAGGLLAWIGLRADEPTYIAPRAADSVPIVLSGDVPAGFEVRTLDVTGMCCTGCTSKLYDKLAAVEGVREIAIDANVGTAQVVVPEGEPVEPLVAALTFDVYRAEPRP